MSIFPLAPILAKTLNKHYSAASSTITSSFSPSFSISSSLISPTSTVRLYVVSIASSLACNSCISLSLAGSGIYLSLLLGISLSSVGLGIFLSLLLDGMSIKFSPFSLLQKANKLF
jgi:hypothetical protein